jgi:hypothetical protein
LVAGSGIFPAQAEIRVLVESMARFYGTLGGVTHAEPLAQKEVAAMGDVNAILLKSNGTDFDVGIRTAGR